MIVNNILTGCALYSNSYSNSYSYSGLSSLTMYSGSIIRYYAKSSDNEKKKSETKISSDKKKKITIYDLHKEIDIYTRILLPDDQVIERIKYYNDKLKKDLEDGKFKFDDIVLLNNNLSVYTTTNNIVFGALFRVLVKGLSPYYNKNCFSKYHGDINNYSTHSYYKDSYDKFMNEVNSWSLSHALIVVEFKRRFFNIKLLIEKLKPIVDSKLLLLIARFLFISQITKVEENNNQKKNIHYEGFRYDFKHHYGECYEDGVIPLSYHSLRYELYNFLMDDVDISLSGIEYARYYEYILIPIRRNIYLQEYTESSAQEYTDKMINKIYFIFCKFNYPEPFIMYVTKGDFGVFIHGFCICVESDGNCNIEEYLRPPFILESDANSSNAYDDDDDDDDWEYKRTPTLSE